jgi:hypothetical protein
MRVKMCIRSVFAFAGLGNSGVDRASAPTCHCEEASRKLHLCLYKYTSSHIMPRDGHGCLFHCCDESWLTSARRAGSQHFRLWLGSCCLFTSRRTVRSPASCENGRVWSPRSPAGPPGPNRNRQIDSCKLPDKCRQVSRDLRCV